MHIVIDTREKQPWEFPEGVKTSVGTVRQGDYALAGDNAFSIERKSLADFRNTVVRGWDRFQRELLRMHLAGFASKVIIVEGDFADYCFAQTPDGIEEPSAGIDEVFTPALAARRVAEILVFYRTAVLFARDEGIAAALAFQVLLQRQVQLTGVVALPKDQ